MNACYEWIYELIFIITNWQIRGDWSKDANEHNTTRVNVGAWEETLPDGYAILRVAHTQFGHNSVTVSIFVRQVEKHCSK